MKKFKIMILCIILSIANTAVSAQVSKVTASDGEENDNFGKSVSISGNYLIVGADLDDDSGFYSGSAYLFKKEGNSWIEEDKIIPQDCEAMDFFGEHVDISGDYAIIGAIGDDDNGNYAGAGYIFHREGTNWIEQEKLLAFDGESRDYFGNDVAIWDNYAVVGSYCDSDSGDASGAAYIYKREGENWNFMQKIVGSYCNGNEWFGWSVSINGGYIIVGAFGDEAFGYATGAAYIYRLDNEEWIEEARLLPTDGISNGLMGYSVDISGEYAVAGAYAEGESGSKTGAAYVFRRSGTTWNLQNKLIADDLVPDDRFGGNVAISDDFIIISGHVDEDDIIPRAAYVFKLENDEWSQFSKITESDGGFVAISNTNAVTGSIGDDEAGNNAGAAFVYDISAMIPNNPPFVENPIEDQLLQVNFSEYIVADLDNVFNDPDGNDLLYSVNNVSGITTEIINSDLILNSENSIVGTYEIFVYASDEEYTICDTFTVIIEGNALSVSPAVQIAGGVSERSSFQVINSGPGDDNEMNWTAIANDSWFTIIHGESGLNEGTVTIQYNRNDGYRTGTITITAENSMNSPVTVEIRQTGGITDGEKKIYADNGSDENEFGKAIDIWQNYAIVGASNTTWGEEFGSAYIYKLEDGDWIEKQNFESDGLNIRDGFAKSVSIYGNYAAVGAPQDSFYQQSSGAVYIYKNQGEIWSLQEKLFAAEPDTNSSFGSSVALWGNFLMVGAENDDEVGNDAGAVYVYKLNGDNWEFHSLITGEDTDQYDDFGCDIDIYNDYAVIGAENARNDTNSLAGSAYIFHLEEDNWIQEFEIMDSIAAGNNHFGESVSIFENQVIIGASWDSEPVHRTGAAYIYKKTGDGFWSKITKLTHIDSSSSNYFGSSVSITENFAVIGSPWNYNTNGSYAGAGSVYKKSNGDVWSSYFEIIPSDGNTRDFFGSYAALIEDNNYGNYVFIGSIKDDDNGINSGSVYVYDLSGISDIDKPDKNTNLPVSYVLSANYPNPFNTQTTINYQLPVKAHTTLKIYNTLGQEIRTLINENKAAGQYSVVWDTKDNAGKQVSPGIYFYNINIDKKFSETRSMLMIK